MRRSGMRFISITVILVLPILAFAQSNPGMADYWERQKRYALEQMDAAARDRSQCRSTYRTATGISACESSAHQWRVYWNERYMEGAREYEKVR
jgi:hypothetical protein